MSRVEQIGACTPKPVWIYALCDPDTNEPRYIGKTSGYMCERHKAHIRNALKGSRLPVHSWMRGVIEADKPLIIKDMEIVRDGNWAERERDWISNLRDDGVRLYNVTDGGEGLPGHQFSLEHRKKISASLRTGSTMFCEVCGKSFWRKKNEIAKGACRFCSKTCYQQSIKGRSKTVSELCMRRGVAAAAAEKASRRFCKRGHPLSGDNLFRTSQGARGCKACRRIHKKRYLLRLANG